jgi:hypothetical protein
VWLHVVMRGREAYQGEEGEANNYLPSYGSSWQIRAKYVECLHVHE